MLFNDFSYKTAATHLGTAATHLGTAATHPGTAATHPGTAATHPGTAKLSKTQCFLMISTTNHQKHEVFRWYLMQIIEKQNAF